MEEVSYLRVILAFIFVLALIGALSWGLRRWDSSKLGSGLGKRRRLQVVEQLYVDSKRKAAIIRCDDKEHLVLISPQHHSVIAANISENLPPENLLAKSGQSDLVSSTPLSSSQGKAHG